MKVSKEWEKAAADAHDAMARLVAIKDRLENDCACFTEDGEVECAPCDALIEIHALDLDLAYESAQAAEDIEVPE